MRLNLLFPLSSVRVRIANWERRDFLRGTICWEGCTCMLITRIELENINSYRQIIIDFRRGTTAISGVNGSGKTSMVEAIGYALFGFLLYDQTQFVGEG